MGITGMRAAVLAGFLIWVGTAHQEPIFPRAFAASQTTGGSATTASARTAHSIPCTDGVDCLCDRIRGLDPKVVWCEDFEDPNLNDGGRGWSSKYGSAVNSCLPNGTRPNWWEGMEGTTHQACFNITTESECQMGQTGCVFDGQQALEFKVQPGKTNGIVGAASWPPLTTFGITAAMKYTTNLGRAGAGATSVWRFPWKQNEWGKSWSGIVTFNAGWVSSDPPFQRFLFRTKSSRSACEAAVKNAHWMVGEGYCTDVSFNYGPKASEFDQSAEWPDGTWGCVRHHVKNWGTSQASIRTWFNQKLITHVTNLDSTRVADDQSMDQMVFNAYYNGNQWEASDYSVESFGRYEDNWVVTSSSEPVDCEAIGFAPADDSGPPGPPGGLRILGR